MKKFLYFVGVVIGGAVVALLILGTFVREISFTSTLDLPLPVEQAWVAFTDTTHLPYWAPRVQEVHISASEAVVGREFRLDLIGDVSLDGRVTEWVPNERLEVDYVMAEATGTIAITFAPHAGGTRIAPTTTARGSAFHWRAWLPVIKPFLQNEVMHGLDVLGVIVERTPSFAPQTGS